MEVFWEVGYEGASMTDLTSAMGITSPSLYAAFGCKEALFREAVAHYNETEGAAVAAALRGPAHRTRGHRGSHAAPCDCLHRSRTSQEAA